jgi:hypothetical protein
MAETVRRLRVTVTVEGEVGGDDGAALPISKTVTYNFQNGTGSGQVGWAWQDLNGSLASTTGSIDLDGATDFQGAAMSSNNALKVMLFHHTGTVGNLIVGGGDFASWLSDATDEVVIKPGGLLLYVAPDGVGITASTGDVLALESTGGTVTYQAILAGDNE